MLQPFEAVEVIAYNRFPLFLGTFMTVQKKGSTTLNRMNGSFAYLRRFFSLTGRVHNEKPARTRINSIPRLLVYLFNFSDKGSRTRRKPI